MWLDVYDTADFQSQIARLWDQLTPLYEQLHAYVRGRLRQHYGEDVVSKDGPIPAHLLGETLGSDTAIQITLTIFDTVYHYPYSFKTSRLCKT